MVKDELKKNIHSLENDLIKYFDPPCNGPTTEWTFDGVYSSSRMWSIKHRKFKIV